MELRNDIDVSILIGTHLLQTDMQLEVVDLLVVVVVLVVVNKKSVRSNFDRSYLNLILLFTNTFHVFFLLSITCFFVY